MNIPCLTIRPCAERPVPIWEGSNKLIKIHEIMDEVELILVGKGKTGKIPWLWDGKSAKWIAQVLLEKVKI